MTPRGRLINEKELWWEVLRDTYTRFIGSSENHTNATDTLALQIQDIPQGESMKILEEMWMEALENPNHPITGSGSSMCLAIPNWTVAFESPFQAS